MCVCDLTESVPRLNGAPPWNRRPLARKACFERQGGLETSIFRKFEIFVTLGLHVGQSGYAKSSKNGFTWTSRQVYPIQNLILGPVKIPPSKMNLGILHNFGKTTLKCTKRSDIWEGRTSSTLHPNYS